MVLGYHLVLSAYGFWLPNDPRGSCSHFVGSEEIFRFGKATTVHTHHSVADAPHDRRLRQTAKQALKRKPVHFSGVQARAVGRGFALAVQSHSISIWACAIMPNHVHLVVGRSAFSIEEVSAMLKRRATEQLIAEGLHPFSKQLNKRLPSIWAVGEWKVFLDAPEAIISCIQYVEANPIHTGLRPQRWSFVVPYEP